MKKRKTKKTGLAKTTFRVRDMKTGKFAAAWKAARYPSSLEFPDGRFQFRRLASTPAGLKEVAVEQGLIEKFKLKEQRLGVQAKKARLIFVAWAKDGSLLNWYYLGRITAAKDRFRKNLWVLEVNYAEAKKKAGRSTPLTISFLVDVDTGKVEKDR